MEIRKTPLMFIPLLIVFYLIMATVLFIVLNIIKGLGFSHYLLCGILYFEMVLFGILGVYNMSRTQKEVKE